MLKPTSERANRPRTLTGESAGNRSSRGATKKESDIAANDAASAAPTSTTKALLLSVVVPRIYRVYIPPKEQAEASTDARRKSLLALQMSSEQLNSISNSLAADSSTKATEDNENPRSISKEDEGKTITTKDIQPKDEKTSKVGLMQRDETSMAPTDQSLADTSADPSMATTSGDDKNTKTDESSIRLVEIQNHASSTASLLEQHVGYVENEEDNGRTTSIVEHVITQEEMDMVVPLNEGTSNEQDALSKSTVDTPHHRRVATDSSMLTAAGDAIKSFFGVMNKNNVTLATAYMSREEAVAAIKHYDPLTEDTEMEEYKEEETQNDKGQTRKPNTEIKLEELLTLTFRNLYSEEHFFNMPTSANVAAPLASDGQDSGNEWVEFSVMVKQPSIGAVLDGMERIGVGSSVGTIAIFKAELLRTCHPVHEVEKKEQPDKRASNSTGAAPSVGNTQKRNTGDGPEDLKAKEAKLEAARAEWKNAASRLRVEQVKEQIHEQAQLSLDYLSLLSIASILAGIGLITDNAVVIVASMLISPIMGPVMGMTFGSRVLDWNLAFQSIWHEFLSLLLAVLIGVIIGASTAFCPISETWPTEQMSSRGDTTGLVTGIAIAIPSGMGVALSILGNNTSSLVGVAISASLLPPAVNAGICLVHGLFIRANWVESLSDDNFNFIAGISFALTLVNIVCIWGSGILMFYIKEVAPLKSKSAFWSRDIKFARAIQKGSKQVDLEVIKAGLQDAIKNERKSKRLTVPRPRRLVRPFTFNMSVNPVDDEAPIPDLDNNGPTPLTDEVQYEGLEDMANLLGFEDEGI